MNDQSTLKIDDTNKRILRDLQADGRITNVELATRANISAPPCLRRVRALEEEGVIRGYHADVDPAPLGFKETFFALVGLGRCFGYCFRQSLVWCGHLLGHSW